MKPKLLAALLMLAADLLAAAPNQTAHLVTELHRGAVRTVFLGELGKVKARSKVVRRYADRLARDHRMLDRKVMAVARRGRLPVPPGPELTVDSVALRALDGPAFDRAFLEAAASAQSNADTLLSAAALSDDRSLKKLARRLKPIVQEDRRLADGLLKRLRQ